MKHLLSFRFCRFLLLLLALSGFGATGHAATFTVTKLADSDDGSCYSDCSLREAITAANGAAGADTILLASGLSGTIGLGSALPNISSDITLQGPGAALLKVKRTSGEFRIFTLTNGTSSGPTVTISGLTITNGHAGGSNITVNNQGGGIWNDQGILTVNSCVFSGNICDDSGGGIYNSGTLTVSDSTFSANRAGFNSNYGAGGGLFNKNGNVILSNCTFSGNTASGRNSSQYGGGIANIDGTLMVRSCTLSGNSATTGGGIYNRGVNGFETPNPVATLTVSNSTLSDNSATSGGGIYNVADHSGNAFTNLDNTILFSTSGTPGANLVNVGTGTSVTSQGFNLSSDDGGGFLTAQGDQINTDPMLGTLQNNGGATQTIALLTGSPAIDAGNSFGIAMDQRGQPRPYDNFAIVNASGGDGSDIGAYEIGGALLLNVNNPRSLPEGNVGSPGSVTFDISLSNASTQSVTVNYQTANGINSPATAGIDYVEKHGKLTFAPGETLKRVTVFFIGDSTPELNETFFLDLKTPANASIADGRGVGQINNDDGPSLTIKDATPVDEGNGESTPQTQTFTVTLNAPSTDTVTVNYATVNGTATSEQAADYTAASGTLTFNPGETTKTIVITLTGDTKAEPNETYKVSLSKPTYAVLGDALAVGIIRNDDATPNVFEDEPSQ